MVIVYSQPNCVQCKSTMRLMDREGIEYQIIDMSQDQKSLDFVKGLGYAQAPVVYIDESHHWSGFRPDRIKELSK